MKPELIKELAQEEGFDLVALGPAKPGPDADRFLAWIEAGRHGSMDYLAKNATRISSADGFLTGARSAISLGWDYSREQTELPGGGLVARYAAGRDYHRALGTRLKRLKAQLVRAGMRAESLRFGVDAVPVLERALAHSAGLGFQAKSGGIIHPQLGPYLLLAEILTQEDLAPDPPSAGSCGSCRACLDICPTQAIRAPFEVDGQLCLSYTTIEHRGPIPRELREPQGTWVFGCDLCLEVCPYASFSRPEIPDDPDLAKHPALETYSLLGILTLSEEEWQRDWTGIAMRRARREGLRRNAALALGNSEQEAAVPGLLACMEDPDAGLRTAAAWSLARLGAGAQAVDQARSREVDPALREDLERSLDELGRGA
jgi:epoxyqueuosine reductase